MNEAELRQACDELHDEYDSLQWTDEKVAKLLAFARRMQAVGYECAADAIVKEHRMGDRDRWLELASGLKTIAASGCEAEAKRLESPNPSKID